jgi:hypothetical protein
MIINYVTDLSAHGMHKMFKNIGYFKLWIEKP